jgi:hypothetical protein
LSAQQQHTVSCSVPSPEKVRAAEMRNVPVENVVFYVSARSRWREVTLALTPVLQCTQYRDYKLLQRAPCRS